MQNQRLRPILILMAAVCMAGLVAGCATIKDQTAPGPSPVQGPDASSPATPHAVIRDWATVRSGAHFNDQGPVFWGIGQATGMSSATLLRATADNQAQAEMARILKAYFGRLVSASGWQAEQEEKQLLIQHLSQAALQKARIVDHRMDARNKRLQALCDLPLATIDATIATFPHLNRALRDELLNRAQSVHQQMAAAAP